MRLRARFIVDQLLDRRYSSPRLPRARVCLSEKEFAPYYACVAAGKSPASMLQDFQNVLSWTAIPSPVASACKNAAEEHTQSLCESASYICSLLPDRRQTSNNNSSLGFLHFLPSVLGHTVLSAPNVSINNTFFIR